MSELTPKVIFSPWNGKPYKSLKQPWRLLWLLFAVFVIFPVYVTLMVIGWAVVLWFAACALGLLVTFLIMGFGAVLNTQSAVKNWVDEQNRPKR